jgi:hypothetical protein
MMVKTLGKGLRFVLVLAILLPTAMNLWSKTPNPKVRAAVCLNPEAARSILPIEYLRAKMVMAGRSKAEIVSALKPALENKQLPNLESGAMAYMMSKSAYLTDEGDHNMSHLMFYTRVKDGKDWGCGAPGSPVISSPYWSFSPNSPKEQPQMKGLPPILVSISRGHKLVRRNACRQA